MLEKKRKTTCIGYSRQRLEAGPICCRLFAWIIVLVCLFVPFISILLTVETEFISVDPCATVCPVSLSGFVAKEISAHAAVDQTTAIRLQWPGNAVLLRMHRGTVAILVDMVEKYALHLHKLLLGDESWLVDDSPLQELSTGRLGEGALVSKEPI